MILPTLVSLRAPGDFVREAVAIPLRTRTDAVVRVDPVLAAMADGTWRAPNAGDAIGDAKWEAVTADGEGWLSGRAFNGGYASVTVNAPTERVALLEAEGDSAAYVDGAWRTGDVYGTGYVSLPVRLHAGANPMLFQVARGRLRVRVLEVPKPVSLDVRDATLPDLVTGERGDVWAAVVVRNATDRALKGLSMRAGRTTTALPSVPPMSVRKVGFRLAPSAGTAVALSLRQGGREIDTAKLTLRTRKPTETQKRTFVSAIDGSVQYYAVNPASAPNAKTLILSVHGASVEAINQADAYGSKSWANIACPTNRRPYGFDWEDWGRMDALEVLNLAKARYHPDPRRVYLTGHSMGGHGTWYLGVLYPELFGAIGPSAGWESSYTYGGGVKHPDGDAVEKMLDRAGAVGDTEQWLHNTTAYGIYLLHGGADDTVPPDQQLRIFDQIKDFQFDHVAHIEPGQGHWWDLSPEPGADCVDWPPMFDFFSRHARPEETTIRTVDFTTLNPGVSSECRWVTIGQQEREQEPSRVQLRCDPIRRAFVGTTQNVASLGLDLAPLNPGKGVRIEIDGQTLTADAPSGRLWLQRQGETWSLSKAATSPAQKTPLRYGPFRLGIDHRPVLVYGTRGTAEENAWSYNRARFDAETFWYRGNGTFDVVPDTDFDATRDRNRSVVLYGNADTNGAWSTLLANSPVQVGKGSLSASGHDQSRDDLACLFVRPRPGSDVANVVAVSGTGMRGFRVIDGLPYLGPMLGFPDLLVATPEALRSGAKGLLGAGFFGRDWSLASGDLAWHEAAGE